MNITLTRNQLYLLIGVVLTMAGMFIAGCGIGKATEPFRDSGVTGQNTTPAIEVTMPDGFGNAATKCLVPGIRIVTVYHGDSAYGSVALVQDKNCK